MFCILKWLNFLYIFNFVILAIQTASDCGDGWFGEDCQYKCHCVSTCDQTGECEGTNNTCAKDWFGYKCQYHDLLALPTVSVKQNLTNFLEVIRDRNDSTCLGSQLPVTKFILNWNTSYVFTWLRLTVDDEDLLSNLSIEIRQNQTRLSCDERFYQINNLTLDMRCDVNKKFNKIAITGLGLKSLCSLYINGGRNIALKQHTTMSTIYQNYASSNAVDGNTEGDFTKNSCVHTADGDESPWWQVNFTESVVTRYIIYNRMDSNSKRLNGFELIAKLENETVFYYNDTSEEDSKKEYMFLDEYRTTASSVTIYGNRKTPVIDVMNFCEVEIFGECTSGHWGLNCTECPSHCSDCNVDNGGCNLVCIGHSDPPYCREPCKKGQWDINCKESCNQCKNQSCDPTSGHCNGCNKGYWGARCTKKCKINCFKKECDQSNGTCTSGCKPGFELPNCTQDCKDGHFGRNCSNECSLTCRSKVCNKTNGDCIKGCNKGYWGDKCTRNCSTNCLRRPCDQSNGTCTFGCKPGFELPTCTQDCLDENWGHNCSNKCSDKCRSNICNKTNGECIQGCSDKFWGRFCNYSCSENCDSSSCIQINGSCLGGCRPGFWQPHCNETCNPGYWGRNCLQECSTNCYNETCDGETSHCIDGCKEGYQLPNCTTECPDGEWGRNCSNKCSDKCISDACNKTNGECIEGCLDGLWGRFCQYNCSENCNNFNNNCVQENGHCIGGCNYGFWQPHCNETCNPGYWGQNCSQDCSPYCDNEICDGETSHCIEGCVAGFQLPNCTEECDSKHFGRNCTYKCSTSCTNEECEGKYGHCMQCIPGRRGPFCDSDCDSGKYGQNCSSDCNSECLNKSCDPATGDCFDCPDGRYGPQCKECQQGLYGYNCSQLCSDQCNVTKKCNPVSGECYHGCKDGYRGLTCNDICDRNTYGQGCAMNCSLFCMSSDKTTKCHHVNGSCHYGCIDDYIEPLCLEEKEKSTLSLILLVSLLVVASIAVIIALIRICRRQNLKEASKYSLFGSKVKDIPDINKEQSTRKDTRVCIKDLSAYINSHDSQFFVDQFKQLPVPTGVTTEAAVVDENRVKNRYKNIVPYDHSRVHLDLNTNKKESDYINASFIRGKENEVKFIASQGPNKDSLNDFIRMLWEQDVEKVVMLTNLVEDTKNKCDQYWPTEGSLEFGEITVSLVKTLTFADYTIRYLELVKNNETHKLKHFHFTSWPDHGVPLTPWPLVDFQLRVLSSHSTRPIVVHCSAGVGRTGTFIALIKVTSQAEKSGRVDFFNTVAGLREDRILMIQTAGQYEFLHRAAQAAIVCHAATIMSCDIKEKLNKLDESNQIELEYTAVCRVALDFRSGKSNDNKKEEISVEMSEDRSEEKTEDNSHVYVNTKILRKDLKNRFPSIIPNNCDRPLLTCEPVKSGDYINAVFIPGYRKKDQHFLTQLPMPTTVVDFWRLVTQYKVSVVAAFELDKAELDETIASYLPKTENNNLTFPPFEVETALTHENELWAEHTVQVYTNTCKSIMHSFIHLKVKSAELDARKLVSFVKKLRTFKAQTEERMLFTCRDGARYSGLLCVLSLLLDRLDNDSCFNVPLVVGTIKTIRPEVIPDLDQYKTVYESLKKYNERLDEDYFPKSKTVQINNPTFDVTQAEDEMVYSNV